MKILFIFVDQLRSNLLNLYNSNVKETSFDRCIYDLGGSLFTQCYTPAPNTSRSLGCLWTGLYPSRNGCHVGYPKYHMKSDIDIKKLLSAMDLPVEWIGLREVYEAHTPRMIRDGFPVANARSSRPRPRTPTLRRSSTPTTRPTLVVYHQNNSSWC